MRIVLLGSSGQVGWELQRSLSMLGELICLSRNSGGDLTQPVALATAVMALRPQVIVNAAAHTAVDRAQSEPELASLINAQAPGQLAELARSLDALLVHYSTDYVFDGQGDLPHQEDDSTAPLNVYGHTKLLGEEAVTASGCRHLIFRTSWVYGSRGQNFAKTMLRLACERDQLKVVNDQFGAPTGADLIADVTALAIHQHHRHGALNGLYHLAASGVTHWHAYAQEVLGWAREQDWPLRVGPDAIEAVDSSGFAQAARRPKNSRLSTHKLQQALGIVLPPWQTGVRRMLMTAFKNPVDAPL